MFRSIEGVYKADRSLLSVIDSTYSAPIQLTDGQSAPERDRHESFLTQGFGGPPHAMGASSRRDNYHVFILSDRLVISNRHIPRTASATALALMHGSPFATTRACQTCLLRFQPPSHLPTPRLLIQIPPSGHLTSYSFFQRDVSSTSKSCTADC